MTTDEHRACCWILDAELRGVLTRQITRPELGFLDELYEQINQPIFEGTRRRLMALSKELVPYAHHEQPTIPQLAALDYAHRALQEGHPGVSKWEAQFLRTLAAFGESLACLSPKQEATLLAIADRIAPMWRESIGRMYCPKSTPPKKTRKPRRNRAARI